MERAEKIEWKEKERKRNWIYKGEREPENKPDTGEGGEGDNKRERHTDTKRNALHREWLRDGYFLEP